MAINLARRAPSFEASVVRELLTVGERPGMRSLAGGLPDPESFPAERLESRDPCRAPRSGPRGAALQYGPTEGLAELRDRLTVTPVVQRVAHVAVDDLVVTSGSQQALHLLATVLVDPGDSVVVDDPCYLGARQVLTAAGARLAGVPLDGEGLRVDLLADRLRAGLRPRLVYTVPAYQNPSGAVLGTDRREALVALARRYGFVVIEDDATTARSDSRPDPRSPRRLGRTRPTSSSPWEPCRKCSRPGYASGGSAHPRWCARPWCA